MTDVIDRLIQAALDTLHHDTDHGDAVDKYEREVLQRKFSAILARPAGISFRSGTISYLRELAARSETGDRIALGLLADEIEVATSHSSQQHGE